MEVTNCEECECRISHFSRIMNVNDNLKKINVALEPFGILKGAFTLAKI